MATKKKGFNFMRPDDEEAEGEAPTKKSGGKSSSGSTSKESPEHKAAMARCLSKNKSRETCEKLCSGY